MRKHLEGTINYIKEASHLKVEVRHILIAVKLNSFQLDFSRQTKGKAKLLMRIHTRISSI